MPCGEGKPHSALHRHLLPDGITPARGLVVLWRQMDIAKHDIRTIPLQVLYGNTLPILDEDDKGAPWESLQYYPLRDFWCDGKQMISA